MNQERIRRVTAQMKREGLPQLIVSSTASVYYLTGLWVEPFERMLALLLREDGSAALFGNAMFGLPEAFPIPIVLHTDSDDPTLQLAKALQPGLCGVDKFWYSKFLLALMEQRGDVIPKPGSGPLDLARQFKDAAEQAAMRHSSAMNDEVMGAVIAALREGVAEHELASLVNREFLRRGADGEGPQMIAFGQNAVDPHHAPDGTRLKAGESVLIDIFSPIKRYCCDMTRTVFYKQVSERQRKVYELVRKANEAAIAAIRPGVPLSHLDQAARAIISDGGFGDYFTHRLGHGCGLEGHEPPDVSASSHGLLEPGMIFSIEPGIYLPGEFGVRIEDLVLVTERGCELLNHYPKELQVIG